MPTPLHPYIYSFFYISQSFEVLSRGLVGGSGYVEGLEKSI
jgi:hypothetical protein